ncbi:FecR protein [Stieleria maiorica]|uniref:FecR protein n=1 Tax=Stieleria maiorica TaxID=2795974 RepID=A0A5B9MCC0_9BACT|nr:FecR family protein [Stieleria maiorica]QEF97254.1 FecR protein [Stieleria maiorica]
MAEPEPSPDMNLLRQLTLQKCNGDLTEEGAERLSQLLVSSDLARRTYFELTTVHSQLDWDLGSVSDEVASLLKEQLEDADARLPSPSSADSTRPMVWMVAIAASILLMAAGAWWRLSRPGDGPGARIAQIDDADSKAAVLGSVTELVPQSRWSIGQSAVAEPNVFRQGDTVSLDAGGIKLSFRSGAVAILDAPVTVNMLSKDRVRLIRGGIMIDVPKGAQGVAVETASTEVIDIGTIYSVRLAGRKTEVVVFDGEVDLKSTTTPVAGTDQQLESKRRIHAGEAVQVGEDGTLSRIVSVQRSSIQGQREFDPTKLVIASVRDNNVRDDFYSFYEVVPGGMGEDAEAFVDRPHEWNGVDTGGMPAYLVGGDYIKTFNNDKVADDLQVDLTLQRPATLYVLLDNRVEPPDWLLATFEDTGDQIGIDEVPRTEEFTWERLDDNPQVGAGHSIDRNHSIYKRVVKQGGAVSLGPNGNVPTEHARREGLVNMYGVVAVPLDQPQVQ